jgi:hypothetical protein
VTSFDILKNNNYTFYGYLPKLSETVDLFPKFENEDYLYDLQVGRAAQIATVHVDPSGEFSWPELADIQVNSLDELAELLPK